MRPSQYHYTPVEFKISAHFLCTHLHVEANKNGEQIRKCANWDPCRSKRVHKQIRKCANWDKLWARWENVRNPTMFPCWVQIRSHMSHKRNIGNMFGANQESSWYVEVRVQIGKASQYAKQNAPNMWFLNHVFSFPHEYSLICSSVPLIC